jgi:hypothetical protein
MKSSLRALERMADGQHIKRRLPTTTSPPEESMIRHAFGWNESGFEGSFEISARRTSSKLLSPMSAASAIHPINRRSASAEVI